jgi:hypothetical protein
MHLLFLLNLKYNEFQIKNFTLEDLKIIYIKIFYPIFILNL